MFGAFVLMSSLIQAAVAPQPGEEAIKLKAVIGYNGNGRSNMVWSADQGPYNPQTANYLQNKKRVMKEVLRHTVINKIKDTEIGVCFMPALKKKSKKGCFFTNHQFLLQVCLRTRVAAWWWWSTCTQEVRDTCRATAGRSLV